MGSKRFGTLFTEMEKAARSVETYLSGFLGHWRNPITYSSMQGLDSVFSSVRRRSR